ncbi:hypothetical protein L7F22_007425 [Adiantum nelumboides]|nr:hypothetical protein [Adiantum nelumboides]
MPRTSMYGRHIKRNFDNSYIYFDRITDSPTHDDDDDTDRATKPAKKKRSRKTYEDERKVRRSKRDEEESTGYRGEKATHSRIAITSEQSNVDDDFAHRCSHCGCMSTPQWREGPKGPKTLCNPCGIRFRCNMLLPEYRPKSSPTFDKAIHSNRKDHVLEMHIRNTNQQHNTPSSSSSSSSSTSGWGIDVRPGTVDVAEVVDIAGPSTRIAAARSILPTAEQARWDVKDTQAHALIALFVKRTITPHICSAKSTKQAWDILAGLYASRNEAKIALLRKELESKIMNEEDDMDTFLAGIKDINEQLISVGEIISDSSLVQTVLDALPDSYQTFASTWRLMNQRNPDIVKFPSADCS